MAVWIKHQDLNSLSSVLEGAIVTSWYLHVFQTPLTEDYIVKSLPNKKSTLPVIVMTKLFSEKATKSLADFEVQYAYDPITLAALKQ